MRARVSGLFRQGDFFFFHFAVEILGDGFKTAIEETLLDVTQNHAITRTCENVRDAVAHRARAEHCDRLDRVS